MTCPRWAVTPTRPLVNGLLLNSHAGIGSTPAYAARFTLTWQRTSQKMLVIATQITCAQYRSVKVHKHPQRHRVGKCITFWKSSFRVGQYMLNVSKSLNACIGALFALVRISGSAVLATAMFGGTLFVVSQHLDRAAKPSVLDICRAKYRRELNFLRATRSWTASP